MNTEEGRIKKFIKENKKTIVVLGGLAVVSMFTGNYIYRKGFRDGGRIATIIAFEETIKWLDKQIPGADLMGFWLEWSKANPEKVVTIKL